MMGALIKKDYLLLVRNNFLTGIAVLLFILVIISLNLGIAGYFMFLLAGIWQLLLTINSVDKAGGMVLLISSPYARGKVVSSRYISSLILFVALSLVYALISLIASQFTAIFPMLTPQNLLLGFLIVSLFIAITVPLYLKFSEFTVRIISLCLIMGGGFLFFFLAPRVRPVLAPLQLTPGTLAILAIAVSIAALLASRAIAIAMVNKIEY